MKTDIFQRVLEVAPNERGEGSAMTLLWDGGDGAVVEAVFQGSAGSTDVSPERLLEDAEELTKQACDGDLQIVFRSEELIQKLREAVHGD